MTDNYLYSLHKQFLYYKQLGEKTFAQLSDEQLFWQYNPESNSIGIMANHLWGNMMSRFTDFLTTDGEKDFRNRDKEFEKIIESREELLRKWEEGWTCVMNALNSVNEENFNTIVYIRNQGHTITEAFNRQLAHYAYHIGQIVYLGRMMVGSSWESLSIPKGESKAFNAKKFSEEKKRGHFTDDFLPQRPESP